MTLPRSSEPLQGLALARATVDRASHRREDVAWLASAWLDPASRVLVVSDGRVLADQDHDCGGGLRLRLLPTAMAPAGERYLLGVDETGAAQWAVAAASLSAEAAEPAQAAEAAEAAQGAEPVQAAEPAEAAGDGAVEVGLREVGAVLDDRSVGLLVHAIGLEHWHAAHPCCARCGAPTVVAGAGHLRRCPEDGSEHYPRTDPAVIMAVVDDTDRVLLGRQARWPPRRFSTLAGFVEPGESLERAVAREVLEEVGVVIARCTYLGSQPWPFPSSLMLGFIAEAATTELRVDGVEIREARWFTRGELLAAVEAGEVRLPPPVSIARRLIEHWYGGELPADAGAWT